MDDFKVSRLGKEFLRSPKFRLVKSGQASAEGGRVNSKNTEVTVTMITKLEEIMIKAGFGF